MPDRMLHRISNKYRAGWTLPAVIFSLLIFALPASTQDFPRNMTLVKVDYQGLSLFTPDEMTAMSGLKIGRPIILPDIEKATELLSYLGYFKSVRFEYRYHGTQLTIHFLIEEDNKFIDCFFDNFIGLSDAQLLDAIRRKIPSFSGKVPIRGSIHKIISSVLEDFMNQNGNSCHVTSYPLLGQQPQITQYIVFSIDTPKPPICKISFEGDSEELLPGLEKAAQQLMKTPYSRLQISAFDQATLTPLMRKYGYWKFNISGVASEKMDAPDCTGGALAKISFKSGGKYSWGGIRWVGNRDIATSELDLWLGMKNGESASLEKIENGFMQVSAFYNKRGYVDYMLIQAKPLVDDNALTVEYQAQIREGLQFRMGKFINGLGRGSALPFQKLSRQWKLKSGQLFDSFYFDEFKEKCFKPWHENYAPNVDLLLTKVPDKIYNAVLNVVLFAKPSTRDNSVPR